MTQINREEESEKKKKNYFGIISFGAYENESNILFQEIKSCSYQNTDLEMMIQQNTCMLKRKENPVWAKLDL